LTLAALFATFPLIAFFMLLIGAVMKGSLLMLVVICVIAGLGVSGLLFAFRDGSLLTLCLFWVAQMGVAIWAYLPAGPQNDKLDDPMFVAGCLYLLVGLGVTLAARPLRPS
jgi:hypothetical protein